MDSPTISGPMQSLEDVRAKITTAGDIAAALQDRETADMCLALCDMVDYRKLGRDQRAYAEIAMDLSARFLRLGEIHDDIDAIRIGCDFAETAYRVRCIGDSKSMNAWWFREGQYR